MTTTVDTDHRVGGPPAEVLLAVGFGPTVVDRRADAATALTAALREHVAAMVGAEAGVRAGEPDAVHHMRVAARRLRSILRSYRRLFAAQGEASWLADELRWLGGRLGPLRDLQVLRARLAADLAQVPAEDLLGPVHTRIERSFGADVGAALEHVVATLDEPRYRMLQTRAVAFAAAPSFAPRARRRAAKAMGPVVAAERRRLERRVAAAASAPPTRRDGAVHAVRKAAKRLRYAAEAAAPVSGPEVATTARRAEAVQDALGDGRDAALAMDRLRREGSVAGTTPGENGFAYGLLHRLEDERRRRADRDVARALKRLGGRTARPWSPAG